MEYLQIAGVIFGHFNTKRILDIGSVEIIANPAESRVAAIGSLDFHSMLA